jgi:hypothetical protein
MSVEQLGLTRSQVDQFASEGYVVVEDVFKPQEDFALRSDIDVGECRWPIQMEGLP